jgi:1,4-alpha-glucan branching enzyme
MVTVHGSYVQFRFYRPSAQKVYLAGEFNGWQEDQLPMVPAGNGYWLAVLRLQPGSYRFRYRADGQWFTDYAAFGIEYGPYGPEGVVRVAPRPAAVELPQRETAEETASRPAEPALAGASVGLNEPRGTRRPRVQAA